MEFVEILTLGRELLNEHGLSDWKFDISTAKNRLGMCTHSTKTIEYSINFMHVPDEEIRDTILHEIAHALVGRGHGHDDVWRAKCIEVGARPDRLAPEEIKTAAKPNFKIVCEACGRTWYRFRLRRNIIGGTCPCTGKLKCYKIVRK